MIVEPEYEGTLLYDVHAALPNRELQIEQIAFPREIFRNYGTYSEKMIHYGLKTEKIAEKLSALL